jgi:hypothetical protein
MAGANYYDLRGDSTRIYFYPNGRTLVPNLGPVLVYDDGSTQVECRGDDLKIGPATWAGTSVVALVRKTGIEPGAVGSLCVLIPDVQADPGDAAVPIATYGTLAIHRAIGERGPGQLEKYWPLQLTGTAALIKLTG